MKITWLIPQDFFPQENEKRKKELCFFPIIPVFISSKILLCAPYEPKNIDLLFPKMSVHYYKNYI